MRQNLRREPDRDAIRAFEQHDGKLRRQRDGLLVAPVVAELPRRRLRVEKHVLREVREPRLDVTRRRRIVARERVAVIPLRLDEPPALPDRHKRRTDGRIAMRMQLHRRTDDISDLVKAPIVHVPKRVQHAPLHRFQPVINVRHRAIEDHVARVIEEPIAVALSQRGLLVLHFLALLAPRCDGLHLHLRRRFGRAIPIRFRRRRNRLIGCRRRRGIQMQFWLIAGDQFLRGFSVRLVRLFGH